jgi:hypothetical protein
MNPSERPLGRTAQKDELRPFGENAGPAQDGQQHPGTHHKPGEAEDLDRERCGKQSDTDPGDKAVPVCHDPPLGSTRLHQ